MKCIHIITMHAMHNPGSVFQAYALQKYLKKSGYETKLIDYRPSYYFTENSLLKYLIKRFFYFRSYNSRSKKFNEFISKNMDLTKRFSSLQELEKEGFATGCVIVGSDQLWNTDYECGSDDAFYLAFAKNARKISYSTSVGKNPIDEHNLNTLKCKLKDFDYLSVRERSTADRLSSILKKDVQWVCDPVFLLGVTDYKAFIGKPLVDEKYALVYLSGSSETLDKLVEYYKKQGFYIVLAGGFTKRCYCDLHIKDVGPEDFVNLIFNAGVVVSSSFHATAFSIIFHKNFYTLLPGKNGERIVSILDYLGLEHKCSKTSFSEANLEETIDWSLVDSKLSIYISNSKDYLTRAIKQ